MTVTEVVAEVPLPLLLAISSSKDSAIKLTEKLWWRKLWMIVTSSRNFAEVSWNWNYILG